MTDTRPPLPVRLEQTYAEAVPALSTPWRAAAAPAPRLVALNEPLAAELGLDVEWLRSPAGVGFLVGDVPGEVRTVAQAYAGHQFGGYSPVLGDGRALLLGELVDPSGRRRDLHLKGSGPTPYARRGDGLAVLGPMLREFLVSEAMHALGIPTTRSLAVVATGGRVLREGPQPGAVLCRIAASHLRVGTVQYAAGLGQPDVLRDLADYAIARHYPQVAGATGRYLRFYEAVARAQAELVAGWMGVGFVHGVMNTDNVTLSGETIDYGPCAFMERYDPATVFSSIDHGGRYAYGNQPGITQWNLARLGEALLPLIDDDEDRAVEAASGVLSGFVGWYSEAYERVMARKLGLARGEGTRPAGAEATTALVRELPAVLTDAGVDLTTFFRSLAAGRARELFAEPSAYDAWAARRAASMPDGDAAGRVAAEMDAINPVYVPRNHVLEEALAAATAGDLGPFERLLGAVRRPFEERPGLEDLAAPAPEDKERYVTFCGT